MKKFRNFLEELNPSNLEYMSGSARWIIEELKDNDGFVSLDPEDYGDNAFLQKSSDKFFILINSKKQSITKDRFTKLINEYGLGVYIIKK